MHSASAQFEMLMFLAQSAWAQVDGNDLKTYGGNPYVACLARRWGYTLTMRPDEKGPMFYASVCRSDKDTSNPSQSRNPGAALGEAYVHALRREQRLN